jgi:aconitate hydratase
MLIKVAGKCTMDRNSPAGSWCRYWIIWRTLSMIWFWLLWILSFPTSDSRLLGHTAHPLDSATAVIREVAHDLCERSVKWCIIGGWNYGEGSSREHAALELHFFRRCYDHRTLIHPNTRDWFQEARYSLTVADSADDDQMAAGDRITLVDIEEGGSGQESKRTYIEEMRKTSHGKLGLILPLVNGRLCG